MCVVSDVEVKKAMTEEESCGGSGLLVLGKNRKYIPDRSLLSSRNKASGSFEHSHKDFTAAACLKLAGRTAGQEG